MLGLRALLLQLAGGTSVLPAPFDVRVLAWVVVLTLVAELRLGLLPALRVTGIPVATAAVSPARGHGSAARVPSSSHRWRCRAWRTSP